MMLISMVPAFGAIETVSESFVGSSVTIPGLQTGTERMSAFSLRSVRPAVYSGKVSSVGATTITDAGANWTATQFSGRAMLYAEFDSGVEADIQQVSFASRTLSFSGALPPAVAPGSAYRIREHHTIAEVFGSANQFGLRAAPNAATAEQVQLHMPQSQEIHAFFYLTFNNFRGWVRDNNSPGSNVVIYPEQGIMLVRKTAGDLTLTTSGPLKQGPSVIPIYPGYNLVGLYNRTAPARFADLNLITGNPNSGFVTGRNVSSSDNLLLIQPDGLIVAYYYLNLPGFEGWYSELNQPAANITIPPGSAFLLYRLPTANVFHWTLPSP